MKRPYLNQDQRELIRIGSAFGDFYMFDLAWQKHLREYRRSNGWIKRVINKLNERL